MKLGIGLSYPPPLYPGPHHEGIHGSLDVPGLGGCGAGGELLYGEHLSALHCDGLGLGVTVLVMKHCITSLQARHFLSSQR